MLWHSSARQPRYIYTKHVHTTGDSKQASSQSKEDLTSKGKLSTRWTLSQLRHVGRTSLSQLSHVTPWACSLQHGVMAKRQSLPIVLEGKVP